MFKMCQFEMLPNIKRMTFNGIFDFGSIKAPAERTKSTCKFSNSIWKLFLLLVKKTHNDLVCKCCQFWLLSCRSHCYKNHKSIFLWSSINSDSLSHWTGLWTCIFIGPSFLQKHTCSGNHICFLKQNEALSLIITFYFMNNPPVIIRTACRIMIFSPWIVNGILFCRSVGIILRKTVEKRSRILLFSIIYLWKL